MSEDHTYEEILARCLARVSDSVDKREGSVIYDALAPACAELAILYTELDTLLDRAWADTATGADLDKKVRERSITRDAASEAVRKGVFTGSGGAAIDLPVGTRFSGGDLNYAATEKIADGQYKMSAETPGAAGNTYFGTLFPIDYVEGLATAVLADVLVPGEDEEDDDSLRARYFESFDSQSFGGNRSDYREKVLALDGVGAVKIFRAPSGGGSVRLVLVDSLWGVPSQTLIDEVQLAVDPEGHQGEGIGLAPIGHVVAVEGAGSSGIDVSFTLTLDPSITWPSIQAEAEAAIQEYLTGLVQTWEGSSGLIVRVSQIETRLLNITGVLDIQGTTINGGTANILLGETVIPILGAVTNGTA